jgi:cell division protein FtsL
VLSRLAFSLLLAFIILCIILDALEQVWVEWKRLLWGELGMAVREKMRLTIWRTTKR